MILPQKPLSIVAFVPADNPFVPLLNALQDDGLRLAPFITDLATPPREVLKTTDAIICCIQSLDASFDLVLSRLAELDAPPIVVLAFEAISSEKELHLLGLGAQEIVSVEQDASLLEASNMARRAILRSVQRHRRSQSLGKDAQNRRGAEAQAVLNLFPIAVIITSEDGTVLLANQKAHVLIEQKDAMFLDAKNHLRLTNQTQNALLYQTIANAHLGVDEDCALAAPRQSDDSPLSVMVAPVSSYQRRSSDHKRSGVTLFITDPKVPIDITPATLEGLYGFTAAEARLVINLVGGHTLEEIAATSGTSTHTLRNHLKSAFRKTETNRQAELVKLVLTGPAVFRRASS